MPTIAERAVTAEIASSFRTNSQLVDKPSSASAPSPDPAPAYGYSPVGNPSPFRGFPPVEESLDSDIGAASPLAARMRRTVSASDSQLLEQILTVESHAFSTSRTGAQRSIPVGTPQNVNMIKLVEATYTNSTGTFAKVTVSFQRNQADPYWGSAEIWVSNYQGGVAPIYITTIQSSPSSFTLNKTGEIVTVTLVSVSTSGVKVPFSQSPSTVVKLN